VHALSTCHNPITYRFVFTQGSSLDAQNHRQYFPPDIQGVSTSQQVRHSVVRLACSLAVVCGGSLRHIARLFSALFLLPTTKSSITRWMDAIGAPLPTPEALLQQLLARTPATACPIDGSSPLGTDHCVMVVQDEQDRILMTHAAPSEHGEDAKQFLPRLKDHGLQVTAAFSDDSQRCTEAIKAVFPAARFQADPFHTVKHVWGHRKTSLRSYRRKVTAHGEDPNDAQAIERAKMFWQFRWSLLKKPTHVSVEEQQAIATLENEEAGCVPCFRTIIRQLVTLFDHSHSAAQAKLRRKQLRKAIHALEDPPLAKILQFLDDHWDHACRYRRNKGMGKHRRGSHAESGRRLRRRLEKNHDGIRSAATRQYDIQISQAITYLSLDVADFLEQGPQITGLPGV